MELSYLHDLILTYAKLLLLVIVSSEPNHLFVIVSQIQCIRRFTLEGRVKIAPFSWIRNRMNLLHGLRIDDTH
jgi:hypothetical protein